MKRAYKESSSIETSEIDSPKEIKEFNDLIKNWTETSQKILLTLNKNEEVLTRDRDPKSLIAFGAMGAHISLALQALKATESDL